MKRQQTASGGNLMKFLWKEFIFGGHLQSLGAVSIVFIASYFLLHRLSLIVLGLAYLLFYPLYLYNRFKELAHDETGNRARTAHIKRYGRHGYSLIFLDLSLFGALLILAWNLQLAIFALGLLGAGLLYTDLFKGITARIPLFKDFYVALFFALIVFLPLLYYGKPEGDEAVKLLFFSLFAGLEALLMQNTLDIKDVEADRLRGLKTLSVLMGEKRSINLLAALNLVASFAAIVWFRKTISLQLLSLTFFESLASLALIKRRRYAGYILESAKFLIWPFFCLIPYL